MLPDQKLFMDDHAERLKDRVGKPYQPSNGDEGTRFMARFCDRCTKGGDANYDGPDCCGILLASMLCDKADEDYPKQWTYNAEGQPECTAFELRPDKDEDGPSGPLVDNIRVRCNPNFAGCGPEEGGGG